MSDPKTDPKPSPLGGFDWQQSIKQAEASGVAKADTGAPQPSGHAKTTAKGVSPRQKQPSGKAQMRLRVKV